MNLAKKLFFGAIALAVIAEASVRFSGITDFPVYQANNRIGYIPAPDQSGSFLNKNDWEFNSQSMGAGPFSPGSDADTLLIGDSIVLGGNPYRKHEKLGPRLQGLIGGRVWPISAGSWGMLNELTYLKMHPRVVDDVDSFVFVVNSADFGRASEWQCDLTHPLERPTLSLVYVFRKNVYDFVGCGETPEHLRVSDADWRVELRRFFDGVQKPVTFVMYPHKAELTGQKSPEEFNARALEIQNIADSAGKTVRFIFVAADKHWGAEKYKDNIHPTPDGMALLARIISDGLKTASD